MSTRGLSLLSEGFQRILSEQGHAHVEAELRRLFDLANPPPWLGLVHACRSTGCVEESGLRPVYARSLREWTDRATEAIRELRRWAGYVEDPPLLLILRERGQWTLGERTLH